MILIEGEQRSPEIDKEIESILDWEERCEAIYADFPDVHGTIKGGFMFYHSIIIDGIKNMKPYQLIRVESFY